MDNDVTVIFAITPDAQSSSFDRRKAKANSLAKCSSIDVRNSVLITNSAIREIKTLPRNVSVGVRRIVRRQPGKMI